MELSYDIFHIVTSYLKQSDVLSLTQVCSTYYQYTDDTKYGKFGNVRLSKEISAIAKRVGKYYKAPLLPNSVNRIHLVLAAHIYNSCTTLIISNSVITWENHISAFGITNIDVKPPTNRIKVEQYNRIVIDNANTLGHKYSGLFGRLKNKSVWALYNHTKGGISLFRHVFASAVHMPINYIQLQHKFHKINYDTLILDTIGRSFYENIIASRSSNIDDLCNQYPMLRDCLVGSVISRRLLYAKILSLIILPDIPYIVINDSINKHSVDSLELGNSTHAYITSMDQMKLTTVSTIYLFTVEPLLSQIHYYTLARYTTIYSLTTSLTVVD